MSMANRLHVKVKIKLQFCHFFYVLRKERLLLVCKHVVSLFRLYCNGGPYHYFYGSLKLMC